MSVIRSYAQIKNHIKWDNEFCDFLLKHGMTPEDVASIRTKQQERQKKDAREFYQYQRKYCIDPLSVPIRNNVREWRSVSTDNGETRTDFIIIPDIWGDLWGTEEGYSQINEDIEELVFSTVGYRSMYDFPTGHIVTYTWGFKRVPCGIAVVHTCGIDW